MKQISMRISDSVFNYLESEAKKKGTNPTEIVRQTIIKNIEQENLNSEIKQMLDTYLEKLNNELRIVAKNEQMIFDFIKTLKGVQK